MVSISFPPVKAVSSNPVVIQARVANFEVGKVYLDNGSSSDIIYEHCFQKLPQRVTDLKRPSRTQLVSFMGESNRPVGEVSMETSDMTGVPRELAEHALNANPNISPIRQKKRGMSQDRSKAACEQVNEMVEAGILREVKYQTWVANPVMVKKPDVSWRLCVDFKYINKACPKDNYPLPEIDWKVESLDGFRLKCFLDAYKGYHQISMKKIDEDKTAFHTDQGIYCFEKMPFGLKNVGATYQRLIDKAFRDQIGRNVEAFVDDIVIKSQAEEIMLADVQETFDTLRSIDMKLNPSKCSFGMEEGKFLGHIVTPKGIKANPKKIQAVIDMASPRTKKQVQSLNGKLAALARFLSKSAEWSLPFFRTLKGCLRKQDFSWSAEAEEAFKDMKKFLADLPTLTTLIPGETLTLYLAASKECVSAVLLAERSNGQMPIYFVSRALKGPEINYPCLENLALALVHAARRLRRYFQGHPIRVLTDKPIRQVLAKPEVSGRLAKWAIELGEHEISFHPRTSIKGQILADFLAETDSSDVAGKEVQEVQETQEEEGPKWTLFTDGASNQEGSGAGLILIDPEEIEYTYALRFNFPASNNEAEYEALLAGLRMLKQMGVKKIQVFVDSQLVANQINGTFEANQASMQLYLEETKKLIGEFESFHIEQVRRNQNKKADALSKLASLTFAHLTKEVLVEVLQEKSIIKGKEVSQVEEEEDCWMTPIYNFIKNETLPEDNHEAQKVRMKAPMYLLIEDKLFRKSFLCPHLRCVGPSQAQTLIQEVHGGTCGIHAGPRSVATKIMRLGYYWPSMNKDAKEEIEKWESCQIHAPISRMPKQDLIPVNTAWPFYKWGIDIVGPFPVAVGNVKFLIVAVDYFSKWVEAKPLATITGQKVINFVWEYIVCRFGVPHVLVSDKGKQFAENPFKTWCEDMDIRQVFTSVAHPQANGQVEVMNKAIVGGIKARLGKCRTGWVDELVGVLWAHRTTPRGSTMESPFSLVYGTEAVIPPELSIPSHRIVNFNPA
uniref:uncharacterized protein LOC122585704 n=1 Tax=Erigeron canadensis TaxID=72917 RepID=UPI001CB90E65|nr:uncharacterized protein LOC122585704 [Erigeron canadensis]